MPSPIEAVQEVALDTDQATVVVALASTVAGVSENESILTTTGSDPYCENTRNVVKQVLPDPNIWQVSVAELTPSVKVRLK